MTMEDKRLHLEDLAVGMTFRSAEHALDAGQIKAFAAQFDPQPFHLDEAAAASGFFGGLAASGWHTAAITMRLLVGSLPFARGVIGASAAASWPHPTRPGDVLHVESRIVDITPSRSRPDRGIVVVESLTSNQAGEPRQALTTRLLAFRREG